jgi:hypothetical protein
MLSQSGPLPKRSGFGFEVKWDGVRAVVGLNGELRVRSRRGWNMTELVPELAAIPAHVVLEASWSPSTTTVLRTSPTSAGASCTARGRCRSCS